MSPTLHVLDWCGCSLGLVGAYTLALRLRISRYGWVSFFIANIAYVFMAGRLGLLGLLAQQVGFMGSSAIGIYRHFFVRAPDEPDGRADQAQAWAISTRLAAVPSSYLTRVPKELARLIEDAKALHTGQAQRAEDPAQRGDVETAKAVPEAS